jgi:hypothetical protein
VLALYLNLGNIHLPLSDKKQAASKWLDFLVNVPFRSALEIVTTFVTEPPSLSLIAYRRSFGQSQKIEIDKTLTLDYYTPNRVFVSPAPRFLLSALYGRSVTQITQVRQQFSQWIEFNKWAVSRGPMMVRVGLLQFPFASSLKPLPLPAINQ